MCDNFFCYLFWLIFIVIFFNVEMMCHLSVMNTVIALYCIII